MHIDRGRNHYLAGIRSAIIKLSDTENNGFYTFVYHFTTTPCTSTIQAELQLNQPDGCRQLSNPNNNGFDTGLFLITPLSSTCLEVTYPHSVWKSYVYQVWLKLVHAFKSLWNIHIFKMSEMLACFLRRNTVHVPAN